jgi:hypothetical protein
VVATRSELAVRRWSIVTDELIGQLRLLPFGAGETAGGVIMRYLRREEMCGLLPKLIE